MYILHLISFLLFKYFCFSFLISCYYKKGGQGERVSLREKGEHLYKGWPVVLNFDLQIFLDTSLFSLPSFTPSTLKDKEQSERSLFGGLPAQTGSVLLHLAHSGRFVPCGIVFFPSYKACWKQSSFRLVSAQKLI